MFYQLTWALTINVVLYTLWSCAPIKTRSKARREISKDVQKFGLDPGAFEYGKLEPKTRAPISNVNQNRAQDNIHTFFERLWGESSCSSHLTTNNDLNLLGFSNQQQQQQHQKWSYNASHNFNKPTNKCQLILNKGKNEYSNLSKRNKKHSIHTHLLIFFIENRVFWSFILAFSAPSFSFAIYLPEPIRMKEKCKMYTK